MKQNYASRFYDLDTNVSWVLRLRILAVVVTFFLAVPVEGQNGTYDLSLGSPSSNTVQQKAGITPFAKGRRDTRSQYLYLASELTGKGASAGTISSIAFNVTHLNGQAAALTNVNIFVSGTSANELVDGTNAMPPANANTPNKSYPTLLISDTGWVTLTLDIPFVWNGTDNIIVEICKSNATKVANNYSVQCSQGSGYMTRSRFTFVDNLAYHVPGCNMTVYTNTGNNVAALTAATDRKTRPDLRFTFACDGSPMSGIAVVKSAGNGCFGDEIEVAVEGGENSSGLAYQWQMSTDDGVTFTNIDGEVSSKLHTTQQVDKVLFRRQTKCGGYSVDSESCTVEALNKWNGTSWSRGVEPGSNQSAVIDADFSCGDFDICSLIIKSGTMTIEAGKTLTVGKAVVVDGGSLTFEDSANLLQGSSDAVNSGNVVYKRNSQPVRRFDFTYWSSPVQQQQLLAFSPNTQSDKFMSFNAPANSWTIENTANNMVPGRGYIIRAPQTFAVNGAGQVFEGLFYGVPNNGDIEVPVAGAGHWNLIGNPYPSAISAEEFLSDHTNGDLLDGTFYFWTHNTAPNTSTPGSQAFNYTSNDYAMWNLTGGVGNSANSNGNNSEPNGMIASGQSFMVKGKTTDGVVTFKNSMRKGSGNGQFFRTSSNQKHRIWLQLAHAQGFKQALVGYMNQATDGFDDGFDGDAMDGSTISFYSLLDNRALGIQGLPLPFNETDVVPMGFKTTVAGSHQLSLFKFDGMFNGREVFVEDLYANVIHNLKDGVYTFTSAAGTFNDRFVIRYTSGQEFSRNARIAQPVIYKLKGDIFIDNGVNAIAAVNVYDLSGRLLYSKGDCNGNSLEINCGEWATQVVLIRIQNADGKIINKKIGF